MNNLILQTHDEIIIEKAIHHIHAVNDTGNKIEFDDGTCFMRDWMSGKYYKAHVVTI